VPYITQEDRRQKFSTGWAIEKVAAGVHTPGDLNYAISSICDECLQGQVSYTKINEIVGVLECVKMELYRRVAAPYEDKKMVENGDVYLCLKQ
jgi:hypothetical protein